MLIHKTIESLQTQTRVVRIMSDLAILEASIKTTLLDVAKQASALGTGLQNAAPGEKLGSPNNSVQYLLEIAEKLNNLAAEFDELHLNHS